MDAHHTIAVADGPGPFRIPRLRGHEEISRESRGVPPHLHINASNALDLIGKLAHHSPRRFSFVWAAMDAERTRIVSLDGECLCESGYRRTRQYPDRECDNKLYHVHDSNVSLLLYDFEERRSILELGGIKIKHKPPIFYIDRYLE